MCIFCAAIPAAVSLGAVAKAKQKQASIQLEETVTEAVLTESVTADITSVASSVPQWLLKVPVGKTTTFICVGRVTASVVYHAGFGPA